MMLNNYRYSGSNEGEIVKLLECYKLNRTRMLSMDTILDVSDKLQDGAAMHLSIMWARQVSLWSVVTSF